MSIPKLVVVATALILGGAAGALAQEGEAPVFPPLEDFESVEAFEASLIEDRTMCLSQAGGGSMAARCFRLFSLWDHELNLQYRSLMNALDAAGKQKLRKSQRAWLSVRDSTLALNAHVDDFSYRSPGTMWVGMRAERADRTMARMVRTRALMLREWHDRLARGPITEESLLND